MVLKSFAKINLSLSVNSKLKSGFHDLQSIYCLVDLFDTITINKIKNKFDKISFRGKYSNNVNRINNSVQKILSILRKEKLISGYYSVIINKKIPVFSGLGGGASNAAVILNFLLKKKMNYQLSSKIAKHIGTDFRLFFYNQGYQSSIRKVSKLNKKYKLYFLLIFPNIKCSTREIYSKVKKYTKKNILTPEIFESKNKFIDHLIKSNNDLQSIVEKKHTNISRILLKIREAKGCYLSRITGSGSACYGLFVNEKCSKAALKKLRKEYPKFSISIAKTI